MTTRFSAESSLQVNEQVFVASLVQQNSWILDQLEDGSSLNTLSTSAQVRGTLSAELLQRCLDQLVQRHDILRTTLRVQEGQLVQVIAPDLHVPVSVHNLQTLSPQQLQARVSFLTSQQSQPPFDLQQGPLLRCSLLRLPEECSLLVLSAHRAICDDWSLALLMRELANQIEAGVAEQSVPTFSQTVPYAQVALDQQGMSQEERAAHLDYWRHHLDGAPTTLPLPIDYPRPAVAGVQAAHVDGLLSPAEGQRVQALAQQYSVEPTEIWLAAFVILLARSSAQDDLVLGVQTPGRDVTQQEQIGPYASLLLVRPDLSDDPEVGTLVQRVQGLLQAHRAHEALPFETILKAVHPTRVQSQHPLFQVVLALPWNRPPLPPGWTFREDDPTHETTQYDLQLELRETTHGLTSRFTYRRDLFAERTIQRMSAHWLTLIQGMIAEPKRPIHALPLLPAEERALLLEQWTATERVYPLEQSWPQLFEAQVHRTPTAIAAVWEGQQLSYEALNARANQLAHGLQERGVGPEVLVGLLMQRGLPLLMSILAVFKAGGAYVPLDPQHPEARLRRVLEQSHCQLVLTTQDLSELVARCLAEMAEGQRATLVEVAAEEQRAQVAGWEENLPVTGTPQTLAYVIYTSGSTGLPKGAMVERRGMINHLYAKIDALSLTAQDRVAQTASHCFDISVWQMLAVLLVGGQVHIIPDALAHDGRALLGEVEAQAISILETVPSLLRALLEQEEQPSLKQLRWMIPTGEALPVELSRRWLERYPQIPLLNAYGPTECSDDVTHQVIEQPPDEGVRSVPIGKAIPNMRLYVLDRWQQPVPIGTSGELYVGGIGVGRGYLGDEERTRQAFVPDPFGEAGTRLYRTGDLGRYLEDGALEFLGRRDQQVKVRGYRIELGEIEEVLRGQEGVRDVVVEVREDRPGVHWLVAYVVWKEGEKRTLEELKRGVKAQVPVYMVPGAFVELEALPLTGNGKVDRKALPEPERGSREGGEAYVAARGAVERTLVAIWEEMLGVKPIGIRDDFFALGGDSLLAVRVFGRIEKECGKRVELSVLFGGATVERVAEEIEKGEEEQREEEHEETRAPLVTVQAGGSRRPFFFLHGQWEGGALYSLELAHALGPEQPFYLLEPYRFEGLKVPSTLEEVAAEHIRTMRRVQPEGPYQFGGWCNGALIAYEMARQLWAQGQTVDPLVLMDSDAPAPRFKWDRRVIVGLCRLLQLGPDKQADWFLTYRHLRLVFHYWRLKKNQQHEASGQDEPDTGLTGLRAIFPGSAILRQDWIAIYDWIAAGYMPHLYSGKITFFWTEEEPWRRKGWRKLIRWRNVNSHIIPGDHMTSRTRYLPVLAEHLRQCIDKVR